MIEVQLFDGTVLEFPQGTSQDVIDRVARQETIARQGKAAEPKRGFGQTIYENVVGSGEVDTPGERAGELIKGAGAGMMRGAAGLLGLPGDVAGMVRGAAQYAGEKVGVQPDSAVAKAAGFLLPSYPTSEDVRSGLGAVTGGRSEFVAPGTLGKYAATIGEFIPGAVGGGPKALAQMVAAGAASETAGQITEGAAIEPFARIIGALAPSMLQSGIRAVDKVVRRGGSYPSVDALRAAKNEAYQAADDSGVTFNETDVNAMVSRAENALAQAQGYVPEVDKQTLAAISMVKKQSGSSLTLSQLDKLRQGLWKRYNAAPNEDAILDLIDVVDDAISTSGPASEIMAAARVANTRFKKAELLDNAFTAAERQTAATGSGGNVLNKFRQAVAGILNNPKKVRFFTAEERAAMDAFVSGNMPQNALRLIGKLSPSGNGLMAALNIGAAAINPAMLGLTAAGVAAKGVSDSAVRQGADDLMRMIASGVSPAKKAEVQAEVLRLIPGIYADQGAPQ